MQNLNKTSLRSSIISSIIKLYYSESDLAECGWDLADRGWDLAECVWDLAEWLERLAVNAKAATVLGFFPASSNTVESEGRQMKP